MGCTASTLVAAEPSSEEHQQGKGDAPVLVMKRLGRGSLAGGYNRVEEAKPEKHAAGASGSGTAFTRSGTGRRVQVRYSYLSQRGYYPDQPNKVNQDAVHVQEAVRGDPCQHLFAVLDGHGEFGAECATFATAKVRGTLQQLTCCTDRAACGVPQSAHEPAAAGVCSLQFAALLAADAALAASPDAALRRAMLATNAELHKSLIDDTLSGTTACAVLLRGDTLHVANVGDSRAVLAERRPAAGGAAGLAQPTLVAVPLSHDQTPFRDDECQRVLKAGARVLTLDQVEGLKDADVRCWTTEESCDGDPPRLWAESGTYPGTAFTRSIGDSGERWR